LSQIPRARDKKATFESIENLSTRAVASNKNISDDLEVESKFIDRRQSLKNKTTLSAAGLVVSKT